MRKIILLFAILTLSGLAKDLDLKSINVFQAQGIHSSLKYVIPETLGGDVDFQDTYVVGLTYTQFTHEHLLNQGDSSLQFGFEVGLVQHYGLQEILETDIFYFIKFARILPPSSFFNMDFTWGEGISYTFGEPTFDDDPFDAPGEKYTFLNYFLLDLDFYLKKQSDVHLFLRVHHRCGIYGLIAPSNVGSSFLGYGLRYLF
ncbi:MAG: hypothetical protein OEW60_04050 [Thiovulaceae bacterium]|nr:hypothetical protein [Sulfurimonadaceae bacterium]